MKNNLGRGALYQRGAHSNIDRKGNDSWLNEAGYLTSCNEAIFQLGGDSAIANTAIMDETLIWADMPSKTTVDQHGLKTVPIKSTRHEKQHMTMCLVIKANGSKMKPFVVIQGKKVKSEFAAIKGAIVKCSANGWMNDELTENWVSHVWGSLVFNMRFLVWDSFKCHINKKSKET